MENLFLISVGTACGALIAILGMMRRPRTLIIAGIATTALVLLFFIVAQSTDDRHSVTSFFLRSFPTVAISAIGGMAMSIYVFRLVQTENHSFDNKQEMDAPHSLLFVSVIALLIAFLAPEFPRFSKNITKIKLGEFEAEFTDKFKEGRLFQSANDKRPETYQDQRLWYVLNSGYFDFGYVKSGIAETNLALLDYRDASLEAGYGALLRMIFSVLHPMKECATVLLADDDFSADVVRSEAGELAYLLRRLLLTARSGKATNDHQIPVAAFALSVFAQDRFMRRSDELTGGAMSFRNACLQSIRDKCAERAKFGQGCESDPAKQLFPLLDSERSGRDEAQDVRFFDAAPADIRAMSGLPYSYVVLAYLYLLSGDDLSAIKTLEEHYDEFNYDRAYVRALMGLWDLKGEARLATDAAKRARILADADLRHATAAKAFVDFDIKNWTWRQIHPEQDKKTSESLEKSLENRLSRRLNNSKVEFGYQLSSQRGSNVSQSELAAALSDVRLAIASKTSEVKVARTEGWAKTLGAVSERIRLDRVWGAEWFFAIHVEARLSLAQSLLLWRQDNNVACSAARLKFVKQSLEEQRDMLLSNCRNASLGKRMCELRLRYQALTADY
ncbi:MAG: hypothetical protein JST65_21305, partial [Acidobacteria bacterium]|nr:hypothetical protein [Acidobacteriota bacterium]